LSEPYRAAWVGHLAKAESWSACCGWNCDGVGLMFQFPVVGGPHIRVL